MEQTAAPPTGPAAANGTADPTAERLRRLEEAVRALQATDIAEERIALRVLDKLEDAPPGGGIPAAVANIIAGVLPGMVVTPPTVKGRPTWFVHELVRDGRSMFWMYFDARYRLSRTAQLLVPSVAAAYVLAYLFFNTFPLVGWIFERAFDLVLAFVLYKGLDREVARYREAVATHEALHGPPRAAPRHHEFDPDEGPTTRPDYDGQQR